MRTRVDGKARDECIKRRTRTGSNTEMVQTTNGGTAYNIFKKTFVVFFCSLINDNDNPINILQTQPKKKETDQETKSKIRRLLFFSFRTRFRTLITFTHLCSLDFSQRSFSQPRRSTLTSLQHISPIFVCFHTRTAPT